MSVDQRNNHLNDMGLEVPPPKVIKVLESADNIPHRQKEAPPVPVMEVPSSPKVIKVLESADDIPHRQKEAPRDPLMEVPSPPKVIKVLESAEDIQHLLTEQAPSVPVMEVPSSPKVIKVLESAYDIQHRQKETYSDLIVHGQWDEVNDAWPKMGTLTSTRGEVQFGAQQIQRFYCDNDETLAKIGEKEFTLATDTFGRDRSNVRALQRYGTMRELAALTLKLALTLCLFLPTSALETRVVTTCFVVRRDDPITVEEVASHEVGHVCANELHPHGFKLINITVVPKGVRLGCTCHQMPFQLTNEELEAGMHLKGGGGCYERIKYKRIRGMGHDEPELYDFAYTYVANMQLRQKRLALFKYNAATATATEKREVKRLIKKTFKKVRCNLRLVWDKSEKLVRKLVEKKTMEAAEVYRVIGKLRRRHT